MSKTKTLTITMLAGTVIFFAGMWVYSSQASLTLVELGTAGFVILMVLLVIPVIRRRLKNEKLGLPADDELSESIKQKAESKAFGISFYMWAFIAMVTMDSEIKVIIPIVAGLILMGLIFMGYWYYYTKNGVPDENPN
ncbi:MAG: hypothetical protein K9N35_06765 [Candidatus Marinimicrobia bacterium]|nr:hypothetical protein [Candidatus Neomarinimicrobiota bacterium]